MVGQRRGRLQRRQPRGEAARHPQRRVRQHRRRLGRRVRARGGPDEPVGGSRLHRVHRRSELGQRRLHARGHLAAPGGRRPGPVAPQWRAWRHRPGRQRHRAGRDLHLRPERGQHRARRLRQPRRRGGRRRQRRLDRGVPGPVHRDRRLRGQGPAGGERLRRRDGRLLRQHGLDRHERRGLRRDPGRRDAARPGHLRGVRHRGPGDGRWPRGRPDRRLRGLRHRRGRDRLQQRPDHGHRLLLHVLLVLLRPVVFGLRGPRQPGLVLRRARLRGRRLLSDRVRLEHPRQRGGDVGRSHLRRGTVDGHHRHRQHLREQPIAVRRRDPALLPRGPRLV